MLLSERLKQNVIICIVISVIGVSLVVEPATTNDAKWWAYAAAICGSALIGLSCVALKELRTVSFHTVVNVYQGTCLVMALSCGVYPEFQALVQDKNSLLYLLPVGIFAYVAEVCITCGFALAEGGASQVSVLKFTAPLFSALWGFLILGEVFTVKLSIGAALILAASIATLLNQHRSKPPVPETEKGFMADAKNNPVAYEACV